MLNTTSAVLLFLMCMGGFNVRVSYKNFDLAAVFSYQLGGQILDTNYATMMSMTEFGYAQSPDLLKAWKQAGILLRFPV